MLQIPMHYAAEMIAHARQEDPNECCGILAGKDGKPLKLYRITNSERSPYRYNMDSQELLSAYHETEDNRWEFLAFYHSHTHTEAYPSATDARLATWPDTYYILVSLMDKENPVIRAFRINDGRILEEPVEFTDK
mgnify:CR=1 FL=1